MFLGYRPVSVCLGSEGASIIFLWFSMSQNNTHIVPPKYIHCTSNQIIHRLHVAIYTYTRFSHSLSLSRYTISYVLSEHCLLCLWSSMYFVGMHSNKVTWPMFSVREVEKWPCPLRKLSSTGTTSSKKDFLWSSVNPKVDAAVSQGLCFRNNRRFGTVTAFKTHLVQRNTVEPTTLHRLA